MTDLRDVLTNPDAVGAVLTATIATIDADGTVGVDFGGGRVVDRCAVLSVYTPAMGDSVQVLRRDGSSYLVLGGVRDFNATTVTVGASLSFPYNVLAPLPTPTETGTLIVPATTIRSWRNNEGWSGAAESNNAAQGAYSTRWGYYRGCYFYGSTAFSALKGATCTRLRIRLHRTGTGGISGAENIYLAPHAHASIPSSAPYFTAGAVRVGSLAWNTSGEFDLPVSWGQALINGTSKGIGHLYLGTADYAIFHGLGSDSLSGRLTLDWKE